MAKPHPDNGPIGYIYHLSSKKPIRPHGGKLSPADGTKLVVHSDKHEENVIQFRFVREKQFGHFGYIEHVGSSKVVHIGDGDKLILHENRNVHALFTFDLENNVIMHRNGKYWRVDKDEPTPKDDTSCYLGKLEMNDTKSNNALINDAAKFYFGDINAHRLYPYSSPTTSHDWKLLQAFITPKTSRTFEVKYKVGRTKQVSKTNTHAWRVSAEIAHSFFKANLGYDGSTSMTETSTWTQEKEATVTINVEAGSTVCVWQYVYCIAEYDDEMIFQSNIICDTDSIHKKPDILDRGNTIII